MDCPNLSGVKQERANRAHREELYEAYDVDLDLEEHNKQLQKWEDEYNYIRPHQSLDYLTRQWKRESRKTAFPM